MATSGQKVSARLSESSEDKVGQQSSPLLNLREFTYWLRLGATSIILAEVPTMEMKLEVVVLPVSDVDRAKRFYEQLGWRLDADFGDGKDFRGVQFTPPGSAASIHFGKGLTTLAPGAIQGLYLVVSDIEAARADLIRRGVAVSEIFHKLPGAAPAPGLDPERRSYATYATFRDPDGNGWLLQEIRQRLPGR